MSKIIIFGFSHSGTTILKSIIGHIKDVEEIIDETDIIKKKTSKKYIICKNTHYKEKFMADEYKDYIKIFIMRNPIYVYSSINKRFGHVGPGRVKFGYHAISKYINIFKKFIYYKNNPVKNLYTIRYEDMFDNNYRNLKNIFDSIGFKYTDEIFDNSKYKNYSHSHRTTIMKNKPLCRPAHFPPRTGSDAHHERYRTWQINQPFVFMNIPSKLDLTNEQKKIILNNKYILTIYPDIKSAF
tara:strand:- start:286 stop:1005 length:720 start_codon:yes stop_codon:yes gene_type:complete